MLNNHSDKNNIIDGRAIAADLFEQVRARVRELSFQPLLCDIVVGSDPVSLSYVKIKEKKARECGMDFSLIHLSDVSDSKAVIEAIGIEQEKTNLCGLIVQLPLPGSIDADAVLEAIDPDVDVDVLSPKSSEKFYNNQSNIVPPTPGAILHILEQLPVDLSVESFLVLGQGELVGRPIAHALRTRGYEVNTAIEDTTDKAAMLKAATVIITGVGKAGVLRGEDVSDGVIVIDAGTSESGGSIYGDVDFDSVVTKARYITPSPGGVGPVTVGKLLENVLHVALDRNPKNL